MWYASTVKFNMTVLALKLSCIVTMEIAGCDITTVLLSQKARVLYKVDTIIITLLQLHLCCLAFIS
jgi:hypothetical protein